MIKNFSPAVSVVIPMYNSEKYIGDCLESILAQTFEDFEVIVVNNCSTDNSKKIVESYIPKFYDRHKGGGIELKVTSTKKNSGNPGIPYNTGVKLSRGRYIFFVDSDDLITKTALEEVYNLAEKFQADVVHTERFFAVPEDWKIDDRREPKIVGAPIGEYVTEPTFITENFTERAECLLNYQFDWAPWLKFVRRDFMAEKNIQFVSTKSTDLIFTCCLVCSAKKYLRVPNIVNFYRIHGDSVSHHYTMNGDSESERQDVLRKWVKAISEGVEYVNNYLNEQEYFQKNLDAKYFVFEIIVKDFSQYLSSIYTQVPIFQLDELIRAEFSKSKDLAQLTTFLFSRMNVFYQLLIQQQTLIKQLQTQLRQLEN